MGSTCASALLNAAVNIRKFRPENVGGFSKKEVSDDHSPIVLPVEWRRRNPPPTPLQMPS